MTSTPAKFVWYELMTSDPKAAESFYHSVIGWSIQDSGMTDRTYTILSAGPTMVGGLMAIPDDARAQGARPGWLGYIGVGDVDAYAGRVKAAGGAIHRAPDDIPGIGRFAVVADPDGASFVLFQPSGEPPQDAPPAPGTPGTVSWHELVAGKLEPSFAFYSGLFGWTKDEAIDMGPIGIYQTFSMGGPANGGMMSRPPGMPNAAWIFYVNVDAIDAAIERIKTGGGKVVNGPLQVPGGSWIVNATDPQGALFAVVAPKR